MAAGEVFNVGGGPERTISVWSEFGPMLESLLGRKVPVASPGGGRATRRSSSRTAGRPERLLGMDAARRASRRGSAASSRGSPETGRSSGERGLESPGRADLLPAAHERAHDLRRAARPLTRRPGTRRHGADLAIRPVPAAARGAGRGDDRPRPRRVPGQQGRDHADVRSRRDAAGEGARRPQPPPAAARRERPRPPRAPLRQAASSSPTTATSPCPTTPFNRLVNRVVVWSDRATGKLSDAIVAYTDDYAKHSRFLSRYLDKVRVVPPPVEVPRPGPATRSVSAPGGTPRRPGR